MLVMQKPKHRSKEGIFAFYNLFNLQAHYLFLIVGQRSANEQLGTDSLPPSFSIFRLRLNFISSLSRCVKYYSVLRCAVDFAHRSPTGVLVSPQPDLLPVVFSLDASLVIYINSNNIPPIMITNRIYEHKYLLSLQFVSFLVELRTYQHLCSIRSAIHSDKQVLRTIVRTLGVRVQIPSLA